MSTRCIWPVQVLRRLGRLKSLDGKPVEEAERRQAALALRREDTMLALMLSNACLVHKIVRPSCPL
jgi:hypothetical protein